MLTNRHVWVLPNRHVYVFVSVGVSGGGSKTDMCVFFCVLFIFVGVFVRVFCGSQSGDYLKET